ncbi:MAG TPA: hypothetical protein VFP69_10590 [Streptomyces sp.]|nr:hypothetical protein [Streptomyces sp.]
MSGLQTADRAVPGHCALTGAARTGRVVPPAPAGGGLPLRPCR